jgi:hypothetical protein
VLALFPNGYPIAIVIVAILFWHSIYKPGKVEGLIENLNKTLSDFLDPKR